MPYIPKSKITVLSTNGGLLIFKYNREPYKGNYIKLDNGQYFAGSNNVILGPELILVSNQEKNGSVLKNIIRSKDVLKHKILKKGIKNRLEKIKPIPVVKNIPIEIDYRRGFYNRYFSKRINGSSYIEIDKSTYDSINRQESKYDYNLYEVGFIKWYITGNDVHRQNSLEIKKIERTFPNIFYLFPILNEFLRPSTNIQENLYTKGGELYYGDGTEYIGYYHVHPIQGPMVEATHKMYPHPKLYYFNQLPEIADTSYENFLNGYNKITCYKCLTTYFPYFRQEVISIERSRLLGCPKDSFSDIIDGEGNITSGYTLANEACPPPSLPEPAGAGVMNDRPIILNPNDDWTSYPSTGDYSNFNIPPSNFSYPPDSNPFNDLPAGYGGGGGTNTMGLGGFSGTYTCFTANTLITMADGTKKTISSIKVGEQVKSEIGESTVLEVQIHEGDHEVYSINGSKPFVTEEHPFKTIDGWKAIDPFLTFEKHQISSNVLNLQDIVYKIDGKELIESIEKGSVKYPKVYNLSLDNEHVYYANGYLVHNEKGSGLSLDQLNALHEANRPTDDGGNLPPPNFP
jgi:hypothetical protein